MWQPTIEDIKTLKVINEEKKTTRDEYYQTMLPLLVDHVEEWCNFVFVKDEQGKPTLPGGVNIFIAKAIQHNLLKAGVTSRKTGSVSYTYELEFPNSLYKYLRPYRKVRFRALR